MFNVLDHFLDIYTFSPGPWKTEVSVKLNDHQCHMLQKQVGAISKPQDIVLAQESI